GLSFSSFFFSSRRRHTRFSRDWIQTCALPILPVSAKTGVGGFVFPGDRVDMLLTQTVSGDETSLQAAETILRNLRVLATDQSTETETSEDGKTIVREFRTVSLEVTPQIARKLSY